MKEATSLSEATQVKTSGFKNEFIGKTTNARTGDNNHKSSVNVLSTDGGKQHARGTRESASGVPAG